MHLRAVIVGSLLAISVPAMASAAPRMTTAEREAARHETAKTNAVSYAKTEHGGAWKVVGDVQKVKGDPTLYTNIERAGWARRQTSRVATMRVPVDPKTGAVDVVAAQESAKPGKLLTVAQSPTARKVAMYAVPVVATLAAQRGIELPTEAILGALGTGVVGHVSFATAKGMERREGQAREATLADQAAAKIRKAEDEAPTEKRKDYTESERHKYIKQKLNNAVVAEHGKR